jgi:hypothetical protein
MTRLTFPIWKGALTVSSARIKTKGPCKPSVTRQDKPTTVGGINIRSTALGSPSNLQASKTPDPRHSYFVSSIYSICIKDSLASS